ncbi:MAG TPA: Stp1/IreP family PP2C-type Ser/Thr phosphatase [Thermoanaerobaculia bacterium]|nr:Stp1/IreP family PP2C-type Ser/Thr phosphatase [Thermoanaerobaculia bacterium]
MTEDGAAPLAAIDRPNRLLVRVAQKTDVGLVRSENQDFAILSTPEEERLAADRGSLMVVADGMGGHRGGATASRMAATIIKTEYLNNEFIDPPTALKHALESANTQIYAAAQTNPELRGMGTTCSALVIRRGVAHFAHVGDSRIYLIRGEEIHQLTQDHSLVASMVREGLLTKDEAEVHPRRNVLQRSMGVIEQVEIDVSSAMAVEPGDTFILCSDGLHGLVKEAEMREVARLPIDSATNEFIQRAIGRGAPDNVTVIVAKVEDGPAGEQTADDDTHPTGAVPFMPAEADETVRATQESPLPPAQAANRGGKLLIWLLITVIVLGIAGAAIVYYGRDANAPPPTGSTPPTQP